jgi:hypothetical protein
MDQRIGIFCAIFSTAVPTSNWSFLVIGKVWDEKKHNFMYPGVVFVQLVSNNMWAYLYVPLTVTFRLESSLFCSDKSLVHDLLFYNYSVKIRKANLPCISSQAGGQKNSKWPHMKIVSMFICTFNKIKQEKAMDYHEACLAKYKHSNKRLC